MALSSESQKLRVCSFESRKSAEMRSLIERNGGSATVVPSMQELPLDENPEVFEFARALFDGEIDIIIFMTGVGARALLDIVETRFKREDFFKALDGCCVIIRGPKPAAVLREWKVNVDFRAPEPNTSKELLAILDEEYPEISDSIAGKTIAVQEYGEPSVDFYKELEKRDATIMRVSVYRWALPNDTAPLLDVIQQIIDGKFEVMMFTSANQLNNILSVAETAGLREEWVNAAQKCVIASIGPTATAKLQSQGLDVDIEPTHPKMGHLVRETMQAASSILMKKQSLPE